MRVPAAIASRIGSQAASTSPRSRGSWLGERAVEEPLRRVGVRVSAAHEHAGGRLADAERLGEAPSLARRAGGDGPLHREPRYGARRTEPAEGTRLFCFGVTETNYCSGEDYEVEFLSYRFQFNREDFEERVVAAAVKLGLLDRNELDEDETADLVELAADGRIEAPRSGLGWYLVRHWERVSLVEGESLVYWLRKLVFRGAWLDHRVKEGRLEVAWDDDGVGLRLPRPARRPGAARARARALLARAAVPPLTAPG